MSWLACVWRVGGLAGERHEQQAVTDAGLIGRAGYLEGTEPAVGEDAFDFVINGL